MTANDPQSQTPGLALTSSGVPTVAPAPSADSLRCREIRPYEIRRSPPFNSDLKTETQIVLLTLKRFVDEDFHPIRAGGNPCRGSYRVRPLQQPKAPRLPRSLNSSVPIAHFPPASVVSDSAGNLYGVASGADRLANSAGLADPTATTAARFSNFPRHPAVHG